MWKQFYKKERNIWSFNFLTSWCNEHLVKYTFDLFISRKPDTTPSLTRRLNTCRLQIVWVGTRNLLKVKSKIKMHVFSIGDKVWRQPSSELHDRPSSLCPPSFLLVNIHLTDRGIINHLVVRHRTARHIKHQLGSWR